MLRKRLVYWYIRLRGWNTAADELRHELDRLDRDEPDWDYEARVARARALLDGGMNRETLVLIYGPEIVADAEK